MNYMQDLPDIHWKKQVLQLNQKAMNSQRTHMLHEPDVRHYSSDECLTDDNWLASGQILGFISEEEC